MIDIISIFLEMFGWSTEMATVSDVINNIVHLAVGIGIFIFIMRLPSIFLGRRSRLL